MSTLELLGPPFPILVGGPSGLLTLFRLWTEEEERELREEEDQWLLVDLVHELQEYLESAGGAGVSDGCSTVDTVHQLQEDLGSGGGEVSDGPTVHRVEV